MRTAVARLTPLIVLALLAACGGEAPPAAPTAAEGTGAPAVAPAPAALDTAALKARASAALAENRLYAPAGGNAVEDYLELRARLGNGEAWIETALVDLAPYVVIGTEQAIAAEAFDEASRLLGLLERMDAEAPAVPRLRESLVAARAAALERARAEQAEAERRAALAAAEAASRPAAASPAPAPPQPLPSPAPASPPPERTAATPAPARPDPPPAPVPAPPAPSAPVAAAPASRALLSRVQPRFPEAALRRRLEGEVEVLLTVAPDGGVEAVEVLRAEPPGVFEREAVLAARRWRYAPAEARSTVRVVLSFRRPD